MPRAATTRRNAEELMRSPIVFGALFGLALAWAAPASAQADIAAGRIVFNQKCSNCHNLSADPGNGPKGPNLMGVVGRTAGTRAGWEFSAPLRDSKIVWTEDNLGKWLADPDGFVPGSTMPMKVPSKFEREDVLGYIKSVTAGSEK